MLRLPFNLGIGGAVQAGFKYADEHGYDYMVQVDGDGQHDPGEIAKLFAALDGPEPADMICGSRFATATGYIAPISRRTGIHVFAFLLSRLLRQPVTDPTSGFRLYNRRAIALFARDYPHDYPEVEAVLMLHHHRLTMREVPVRMFQRGGGVSSITAPASRSTTWSRCCSRCSSASAAGARCPSRARPRPWPRSTGSDGAAGCRSSRSSAPSGCCSSCSSWSAGAR